MRGCAPRFNSMTMLISPAARFIPQIRNAVDLSTANKFGNAFDQAGLVSPGRDFCDDDGVAAALHLFDVCQSAYHKRPRPVEYACRMLSRPTMMPPVGKSGPWTNSSSLRRDISMVS